MEEEEGTMIEEREEVMVPPNCGDILKPRKAHFLKPILNPKNQSVPQLPYSKIHLNPSVKLTQRSVRFRGDICPQKSWKAWVDALQQTHENIWKKVGIFDAIRASTYHYIRDNGLIKDLAEKWCPKTNTFFFPWGESTITLEDIMILGGFPVLGVSVSTLIGIKVDEELRKKLVDSYKKLMHKQHVSQKAWIKYFQGIGGALEHAALIVLWLSRYVFSRNPAGTISLNMLSIAVSLTCGIRIALAPAVLASIYRDLRLLNEKILALNCEDHHDVNNGSKLYLFAPLVLVQLWAWERFPILCPKPNSLGPGVPRMARWRELKKSEYGRLSRVGIESMGDEFLWRPYALDLENWEVPKLYNDEGIWVLLDSEVDELILSFAKCLRACKLVGLGCEENYFPHRVAMQFGLDQDIPISLPWLNNYDKPFNGLKIYLPPRFFEGKVTFRYSNWWASLFLNDDCDRQRMSKTKFRKLSAIIESDEQGKGKEICSWSSCKTRVLESYDQGKDMEIPSCSSAGTLVLDSGVQGKGKDTRSGSVSETIVLDSLDCRQEDGEETSSKLQLTLEDTGISMAIGVEEEEEIRVNCSNINTGEGSQFLEASHSRNEVPRSLSSPLRNMVEGTTMEKLVNKSCLEMEDAKLKKLDTSCDDCVIISDESDDEDNGGLEALEALSVALDARICRLKTKLSALQAAKPKPQAAMLKSQAALALPEGA